MTREEFIATRTECSDIGAAIADDRVDGAPGYLYLGSLYIERLPGGTFGLVIGNREYQSADLADLEPKLFDFAVAKGRTETYETDAERRSRLAAAYIEQIGYDPFEGDPTISPDEVEQALRDHALEIAKADAIAARHNRP